MGLHILMINDRSVELSGAEVMFHTERKLLSDLPDTRVSVFSIENHDVPPCSPHHTIYRESSSILLNKAAKITFNLPLYRCLRRTVAALDPDLIYLHKSSKYPSVVLKACRGLPLLHRVHDYDLICPTAWCVHKDDLAPCPGGFKLHCVRHCISFPLFVLFYAPFFVRRIPLLRKHISAFLCPSRKLTEAMSRQFPNPCHHLPLPLDLTNLPARYRAPDSPVILFVGLLGRHKGVKQLIEAFPLIRRQFPAVRMTLVGDGADRAAFERQVVRLGLADAITFTGHIPHARIVEHYHQASVLVLPSLWMENSPVVIQEALAMGIPCAGSRRGGIPELLGDGEHGLLFEPTDPASIAEAVCTLLASTELQATFAAKGRRFVMDRANPAAFQQAFMKLARTYTSK